MKALVITDRGEREYVELDSANPEQSIRELVGSALDVTSLPALADHLDMWTAFEPRLPTPGTRGSFLHNDVASEIATAGAGHIRHIDGTVVITAHTDSGILAALAPRDVDAFDQIITEIYTGHHLRRHNAG